MQGVRAEALALICNHPTPQCLACLGKFFTSGTTYGISFQSVGIREATLLSYLLYRGGQHELCLGATAIPLYKMDIRIARRLIVADGSSSFPT